ncbi:hypothetical protein ACTHPH_18140 [Paenibacillus pasadenensis]|uniref:Uncharacterized protein n=1 Tax=Paenibacillus pasadenensis TaxID=217090 RepID=A0A2N5NDB2_9BACL|nr:hypothetical protein [Paenibacillus pasadenensis]PLT48335.1 hypothetical protein B8V81_0467 [Paenibacillus pasadenensis]
MTYVWAAIIVLAAGAVVYAAIASGKRWTLLRSESKARIDKLYRLEAHLKSNGVRTRTAEEDGHLRLLVLRKQLEQGRELLEAYEEETG